ncbi:hypothetical protein H4R21_003529 [Coemansia helicoidea]|uniref:Uncharacterized protein n=1 Tax=Coemansia helicoidea TaxID=1286919 RepID=A0ACC1L276_9FUNG|nr:hypothetical protein H4R21_003529 [Coemansia helicoidea]
MQIAGKVAVVTGGARGIGRSIAEGLAARGARVVLGDILDSGAETAAALNAGRDEAVAVFQRCDVCCTADLEALLARAAEAFGPVDIMINNAGQANGLVWAEADSAQLSRCVDVNLKAPIDGTRLVVRALMTSRRPGCIVNVASILGFGPLEFAQVYSASKAGLVNFTASCATLALGDPCIRVNAVAPVYVDTALTNHNVPPEVNRMLRDLGEVSIDDVVRQVVRCIEDESLAGDTVKVLPGASEVAHSVPKSKPLGLVDHLKEQAATTGAIPALELDADSAS